MTAQARARARRVQGGLAHGAAAFAGAALALVSAALASLWADLGMAGGTRVLSWFLSIACAGMALLLGLAWAACAVARRSGHRAASALAAAVLLGLWLWVGVLFVEAAIGG